MSESAAIVDFIARGPDDEVVLILVDDQPWDGSTTRIVELQERLHASAAYITDGGLIREHPECAGKLVRIDLRCVHPPDPLTTHVLSALRAVLREHGVALSVKQIRAKSSEAQ
jgi:hypothetical protein